MIDLDKIRNDFPILKKTIYGKSLVYLDNAASTQKPKKVLDSISEFYCNQYSNIHRGVHYLSEEASAVYADARETVRGFINANKASEIVFTQGTTDAINLIASSFGETFIHKGDEIIISEMEHHSNLVPWQMLCEKKNANLKVIPVDDNGVLVPDKLKSLITDKTKLIAITYVSNVLGVINPVESIVELAHQHDVPVLVDGAQAIQHLPVDVQKLDCDFFAFSGHKMYAGTGVGVLYGKINWLESLPPYRYGGGMISSVSLKKTGFLEPPFKFEAGTGNIAGVVGLKSAIAYIESINLKEIEAKEKEVYDYALERLRQAPGVTVYGDDDQMCGAISFNLEDIHHYDAGAILDKTGVAVRTGKHCAEPLIERLGLNGTIRASFAVYNTKSDVDRLISGIEKVQRILD